MDGPPAPAAVSTPLYGGAITANIPCSFKDSSNVRPIPDNQEVFVEVHGPDSESDVQPLSIIFDVLQFVDADDTEAVMASEPSLNCPPDLDPSSPAAAILLHFSQLADDNNSTSLASTAIGDTCLLRFS